MKIEKYVAPEAEVLEIAVEQGLPRVESLSLEVSVKNRIGVNPKTNQRKLTIKLLIRKMKKFIYAISAQKNTIIPRFQRYYILVLTLPRRKTSFFTLSLRF